MQRQLKIRWENSVSVYVPNAICETHDSGIATVLDVQNALVYREPNNQLAGVNDLVCTFVFGCNCLLKATGLFHNPIVHRHR